MDADCGIDRCYARGILCNEQVNELQSGYVYITANVLLLSF